MIYPSDQRHRALGKRGRGLNSHQDKLERARQQWLADDHELALSSFREVMAAEPRDLRLAIEVASYLGLRFEIDEASAILRRCEQRLAGNAAGLHQVGLAFERGYRSDDGLRCFHGAVQADPEYFPAWLKIAEWNDRRGHLEEARQAVARCPPTHTEAQLALAKLQVRLNQPDAAGRLLQTLTSTPAKDELLIAAWYELARLHALEGRAREAMESAEAAKAIQRPFAAEHLRRAKQLARLETSFVSTVNASQFERWRCDTSHLPVTLLTGSPRSGTTLIARMLASHPSVELADEVNAYATYVHREMLRGQQGASAGEVLESIPEARLSESRGRYRRWMFAALDAADRQQMLLDKNPSTTFLIPAFRRLFPQATIIVVIRDPRDVVVSCFLQQFALNPVSAMFNRLELAVMRCCAEMEAWLRLRDRLPKPWVEIQYESLVGGNEASLHDALAAMHLQPVNDFADFRGSLATAPVRSPTYAQLFQPIHARSVGRWRAYANYLRPYRERLEPVCQALGYE